MENTPTISFKCDGATFSASQRYDCDSEITVEMEYMYASYSENSGFWSDKETYKTLVDDWDWSIEDEEHFCETCTEEREKSDKK